MSERAGYTVTMFVIDVSPSMGKTRTITLPPGPDGISETREITNLEWCLQFVLLKIQEMIFNGRKTEQCGVILFGTKKTSNCVNRNHGGYEHVTEYIPIAQPTSQTLDLVSAIQPGEVEADAIDGVIVAIQTQALYLGKKSWTRKITLITGGESPLVTSDWDGTADKLNELDIRFTVIGIDFDDDDFKEDGKSEQKQENEAFWHQAEEHVTKSLLGSCYKALEDCALPDVKEVKPASKTLMVRLGDVDVGEDDSIEIAARVHKVTSKAASVTLKRFVKRDLGRRAVDEDGDSQMADGATVSEFAPLERETRYFLRPPPADASKEVQDEPDEDGLPPEEEEAEPEKVGEQVDGEDLVRGYKYGATWVLVEEEFDRLGSKAGLEIIGFMPISKLNRSYLMGEMYALSADPSSSRSQIALSSFIRAMLIKNVAAIARWVHSNDAEPKMAICCPIVEGAKDFLFMARAPFAEDLRNYTFPSLDDLRNKKGETATKHPFVTTDEMVIAMEKWVDKMDLTEADVEDDGTPCPWFDMSRAFNPAIHRTKQALFHASVVSDLEKYPLPPPHPELTRYFESPPEVLERSKKYLERLKKVVDVKVVPPKQRGKKRVNDVDATENAGDDFSVADLLGEEVGSRSASRSVGDLSIKPTATPKKDVKGRQPARAGDETEDEDEDYEMVPKPTGHLPTPARSPTAPLQSRAVNRDIRRGRIIGNSFPLDDFRQNLERGDVVSKALQDMGTVIPEIVDESFATQRYEEALQCMREMRKVALEEDDVEIWNTFLQDFKRRCHDAKFKHRDFWDRVKAVGMSISLITDKEADRHEGYSEFTEMQSVQFINS